MDLDFQIFKKEDYAEYYSWFKDADLNEQLGPMKANDDEWLIHVLNEKNGCTHSIFQNKQLVSVIGIAFPDNDNPAYGITSIAVKPSLRSRGIGKKILKDVMRLYPLRKGQYWIVHVDSNNQKAKRFFEKNGWICVQTPPENDNMFLLEYPQLHINKN